ncbi:MAG: hypothetical protein R3298_02550 [Gammaproteobacteria bacterium]|nr:hypothetical protein [Gammaproteobacteria bacterium]
MTRSITLLPILLLASALAGPVASAPLVVAEDDSVHSVLAAQQDKRVTVTLGGGKELTGTVARVNAEVVHLRELSGMEFFDAVVALSDVAAVVIRTRP